jgi:hypothetical protein
MSLRGLVRRISTSGPSINPVVAERDKVSWDAERQELLQSRVLPGVSGGADGVLPSQKSSLQLGLPVVLPSLSAIRFSAHPRQHRKRNSPLSLDSFPQLFLQPFAGCKPLPPIWGSSGSAFDEAIHIYGDNYAGRLWTNLAMVDWDFIPESVDCIFIGLILPNNSYQGNSNSYAASGLLEVLPSDLIDDINWRKCDIMWPAWDSLDQDQRSERAEQDLFKPNPELFHPEAIYSTYIAKSETGFANSYIWAK